FSFDSGRVDDRTQPMRELGFDEIAILVRTRAQAPPLLDALDRAGLPVQHRTHARLAEHDGVRRLLHELTLDLDRDAIDDQLPTRLERLAVDEELAAGRDLLASLAVRHATDPRAFLAAVALGAEVDTWDPRAERLSLLTLHAAKGLEFPVVFVVGCDDGLLPLRWPAEARGESLDADALAEERRLAFVGMTRAEEHLVLTRSRTRHWRGERRETQPSPFLTDLPASLVEHRASTGPRRRRRGPEPKQLSLL
ncbi:MAG: 3'-5' exonuclease, partial [Acidobacteriota bacterium]